MSNGESAAGYDKFSVIKQTLEMQSEDTSVQEIR
jgi:hypothetical protein